MKRNNRVLYEKIMRNISREIKKALNESSIPYKYHPEDAYELCEIVMDKYNDNNEYIDCRDIDVSNITDFSSTYRFGEGYVSIFFDCKNVKVIDVTGWDVSNATDIGGIFYNCKNLETIIGLETWDVSNAEIMSHLFENCVKLKDINISNWYPTHLWGDYCMFHNADNIPTPDWYFKIDKSKNFKEYKRRNDEE